MPRCTSTSQWRLEVESILQSLEPTPCISIIEPADLEPESSGIMAMLQGEGESFRDFVIQHEEERGLPGFINLVGIETPGLTASLAIAKHVGLMVGEIL